MPVVLDRLPLPNLTWYTSLSILVLIGSVYYSIVQVTQTPNWKEVLNNRRASFDYANLNYNIDTVDFDAVKPEDVAEDRNHSCNKDKIVDALIDAGLHPQSKACSENISNSKNCCNLTDTAAGKRQEVGNAAYSSDRDLSPYLIPEIISFMFHEPLCIWTLINMAYCILILLGNAIQVLVFGELRVSEQQHIKDKFWNFVFYKFIFVFGVMNVQALDEVILWCSWFSVLGFLHLLAQLCKDRFEYLSFSASTRRRTHARLLALLSLILFLSFVCLLICVFVGIKIGLNTFAFMAAECILLMLRTLYVITRYCIHLWDISHDVSWEKRGHYTFLTEFTFELSELFIDMIHHIHMLVWSNMLLTMASLVICMQLRLLFYQLQHKFKFYNNYLRVSKLISSYPEVREGQIQLDDLTCAICWEIVEVGRRLPCAHVFHASCLQAWMHQDLSCPTCRDKLHTPEDVTSSILSGLLSEDAEEDLPHPRGRGTGNRNAFPSPASPEGTSGSFGWRYVSWLPSFSVEQNHTQLPRHHQPQVAEMATTSQLHTLATQAQQMFPDVDYSQLLEDLRQTRSLEQTIDNILEHRMASPPPMFSGDKDSPSHSVKDLGEGQPKEDLHNKLENLFDLLDSVDEYSSKDSSDTSVSDAESESSQKTSFGWTFSKNSKQREQILQMRKQQFLSSARRRFLSLSLPERSERQRTSSEREGAAENFS